MLRQGKCRVPAPYFLMPQPSASILVFSWKQRDDGREKPQTPLQPLNHNCRLRASLDKASMITVISEKNPQKKKIPPHSPFILSEITFQIFKVQQRESIRANSH